MNHLQSSLLKMSKQRNAVLMLNRNSQPDVLPEIITLAGFKQYLILLNTLTPFTFNSHSHTSCMNWNKDEFTMKSLGPHVEIQKTTDFQHFHIVREQI